MGETQESHFCILNWFIVCLVSTVSIRNSFRAEPKFTTDSDPWGPSTELSVMRCAKNTLLVLMLLQQVGVIFKAVHVTCQPSRQTLRDPSWGVTQCSSLHAVQLRDSSEGSGLWLRCLQSRGRSKGCCSGATGFSFCTKTRRGAPGL